MTRVAHLHILGAGMAGLSAAVQAVQSNVAQKITIHEAAKQAGGRCRSYHDPQLERTIDTGSHLILGAYGATFDYLRTVGALGGLKAHAPATIAMHDITSGQNWALKPGDTPLWLLDRARRTAGTGAWAHVRDAWRLRGALSRETVGQRLAGGDATLKARLWDPLVIAIMNTATDATSARLLWRVLRETLLSGEAACRAYTAPDGLSAALVDPAVTHLLDHGVTINYGVSVREIDVSGDRVIALAFADGAQPLGAKDAVIVAVAPKAAKHLLPELTVPERHHCITNVHYRLDRPVQLPGGAPFVGLIGGRAQWLFARGDVLSVTVSVADDLNRMPADEVARFLWRDAAPVIAGDPATVPPHRVIREKAATMAHTPQQLAKRPGPVTSITNLRLAGDWTQTNLPATIEGAVRSGVTAVESLALSTT